MPVGHRLVWHDIAWMQPIASMNPRAMLTVSAPSASAYATSEAVAKRPAAISRTR